MNTRYDDLVIALVAAYEANGQAGKLEDDDFVPDETGDWVKYEKAWRVAAYAKHLDRSLLTPLIKTWHGGTPQCILDDQRRHEEFCAEVDSLPRFRLASTKEHRLLRMARRRASEIIAADTGTSAEQELIKARTALALANDALALAHDLTELNPRNFGSDDVDDLMHEVTEVIKASGKAIAAIERAGSVGPKETMNDLLKPVFDRLVHGRSQGMPEDGVLAGYVKMANDMLP